MPQSSPFDDYHLSRIPFTLGFRPDSTWEEAIIALLKHGHIWEANTLFAIYLRHARPTASDLVKIVDAVPDESDTVYDLVRLTMLVLCSRFLLRQSWRMLEKSRVFDRCKDCAQKLHLSPMDVITDPISSSRAYQNFRLLSLEVENKRPRRKPGVPWRVDDVLKSIHDQGDYMLLLVSREHGVVPVPRDWLKDTGASDEAIECLHSRDKDWKATSSLVKKDTGSGPSSLQAFPAMDDAGKQLAPPRAHRPSQASSTPVGEPLIHNAPAREFSGRSQGHGRRFISNSAGGDSRQWFGNHTSGPVELRDQVFKQNVITKDRDQDGDQIFGSSLVLGEQKSERPDSNKDDKKQASKSPARLTANIETRTF